jgi:hypothetical protein
METSIRKLKIYEHARIRDRDYVIVPMIRLQGLWLKKIGFVPGANIKIHVQQKRLVIEV